MILVKLFLVISCTMMQLPRLTKNQITKPLIEADRTTNMRMGHAKRIAFSRSVPVSVFFRRTATPGESSSFIKGIPVQDSFSFLSFTGIRMLFPATTSENFALGSGEGTLSVFPFFNFVKSSRNKCDSHCSTTVAQISGKIPFKSGAPLKVSFSEKMSGVLGHQSKACPPSSFDVAPRNNGAKVIIA